MGNLSSRRSGIPYIKNIGSACLRKYKITEIGVWYSSKLEGTINMGTKWAIKHDTDTKTHRNTVIQTHRHTVTQSHRHTVTQTHRHTDTQTHRHRQ